MSCPNLPDEDRCDPAGSAVSPAQPDASFDWDEVVAGLPIPPVAGGDVDGSPVDVSELPLYWEPATAATESGAEDLSGAWSGTPDLDAHPHGFTDDDVHGAAGPVRDGGLAVTSGVVAPAAQPAAPVSAPVPDAAFTLAQAGEGMAGGSPAPGR